MAVSNITLRRRTVSGLEPGAPDDDDDDDEAGRVLGASALLPVDCDSTSTASPSVDLESDFAPLRLTNFILVVVFGLLI